VEAAASSSSTEDAPPPPEEEPRVAAYSTPELTEDAARHRAGLDDPTRPPWQNPLHHNNPDMERVFREDFDSEEEFQRAVLPAPPLDSDDGTAEAPDYIHALADEIVHLTMLEMNELINKLGDHYGFHEGILSPDDADIAGGAEGLEDEEEGAAASAAAAERTAFDVKLTGFDPKAKIKVIKEVRAMTSLGLKEAKELVEGAPAVIQKDVKQEQAEEIKAKLEELGATVEIV
jgi:large subunit ribosomal protein L7/L12